MKDTLRKANKTHCERDPFLIKDIKEQHKLEKLTLVFHRITNLSLKSGIFSKTGKKKCEAYTEKWQRSTESRIL